MRDQTGSDWGLPYSKENKAFFLQKLHQNFTKISKFFSAPSIRLGLREMLTLKWHLVIHERSDWGSNWGSDWGSD